MIHDSAVTTYKNPERAPWALGNFVVPTDPRLTDARVPLAHTHVVGDVAGLQVALDALTAAIALASAVAAGGGAGATYGTATIDFGTGDGLNEASVAVTGQATIAGTSKPEAFVLADDTSADHTASDHRYAPALGLGLSCGALVAGTGFTIYARCPHKLTGEWSLRWRWAD